MKLSDSLLQCLRIIKAKLIERNDHNINENINANIKTNIKISEWTKHLFQNCRLLSAQQLKFDPINRSQIYLYNDDNYDNYQQPQIDQQQHNQDIDMINNIDQISWINTNNDNNHMEIRNSVWNEMINYQHDGNNNNYNNYNDDKNTLSGSRNRQQRNPRISQLNNESLLNLFPTIYSVLNGKLYDVHNFMTYLLIYIISEYYFNYLSSQILHYFNY